MLWMKPILAKAIRGAVVALALFVVAAGAPSARAEPKDVYAAIGERLSVIRAVAAWKVARGAPVEDLDREAVVLEKATESAGKQGLDAASTRAFFQAQITAAKAIQTCWITRWNGVPPNEPTPDLVTEIRPELIRLGAEIVAKIRLSLEAGQTLGPSPDFDALVDLECLPGPDRAAIAAALSQVSLAD